MIKNLLLLARPHQYIKNIFIFAPLLFSFQFSTENTLDSILAFILFSMIASSIYIKCWLEPWIKKHNADLLCTELLFEDDRFSGKFSTKNCYGDEKLSRVLEYIDIKQFDKIYAYGDSKGDDAILGIADFPYRVK
jgi:hypothetical protein